MKRSLKTDFPGKDRISLVTNEEVQNEQSMVRALAVNLLSRKGDDLIYDNRGTDLGWGTFNGALLSAVGSGADAKFAALETLFFIRETTAVDPPDQPEEIFLLPSSISASSLELLLSCTTIDGRTLSYTF